MQTDERRKFAIGERVTKTKGSSWLGRVVGFYSTDLTPIGYAVESEREPGSVQIYPEAALTAALSDEQTRAGVQEWHRSDRPGGKSVLLYTLRLEGYRRGEPVMVNDVMVNIDLANGSTADIESVVSRIRSALSPRTVSTSEEQGEGSASNPKGISDV